MVVVMDGTEGQTPTPLGSLERADLTALSRHLEVRRRSVVLAVLDTSFVRTGLEAHLKTGQLPKSVAAGRDGTCKLLIELDTLHETAERLTKFGEQLGVPRSKLAELLNEWLPFVWVVSVPSELRTIDDRAEVVRLRDPEDFAAAALASLLSPCILLTHDTDFEALGVWDRHQAMTAVGAAIDIEVGERRFQAAVILPTAPVVGVGALVKHAADRLGPLAYVATVIVGIGLILLYRHQPEERRAKLRQFAGEMGTFLLDQMSEAAVAVTEAEGRLLTAAVPGPQLRSPQATIVRELALSSGSLSAHQLHERLDPENRPGVGVIRAFLHSHTPGLFHQERYGGFLVGRRGYQIGEP